MKKILSMILALAMVFSLAMPAMAAEPTVNGEKSGDVSATFDPDITISGITFSGDTVYDQGSGSYVLLIPADLPEGAYVPYSFVFAGTNLQYVPEFDENAQYDVWVRVADDEGYSEAVPFPEFVEVSKEYIDGKLVMPSNAALPEVGVTLSLSYSNNNSEGNGTWSDPVSIAFKKGYSITADETVNGTVTVPAYAAEGDTVTVTVTPDEGYELETLTVSYEDADGQTVELDVTDNQFVMPAYPVILTATFAETVEALWGADVDNLTGSGTLDEAITAATAADSTVGYIQLQTSVTADNGYDIGSGVFTLDLNGNTLTSDQYVIALRDAAVQVTLTDTASGGEMISMQPNSAAVVVSAGQLVIDGGSYSGTYAVNVVSGSAEITGGTFTASYAFNVSNGAILTIHDGTIIGGSTSVVTSGTTTINGGTISAGSMGHIEYWGGTLDLSGYAAVNGLTLSQLTEADLTVPNENIILPEGYVFQDDNDNIVDTLISGIVYTIAAENTEPATITGVSITVDGVTYDSKTGGNVTITPDSKVTLTVFGTNLENATDQNHVGFAAGVGDDLNSSDFVIQEDGSAIQTIAASFFQSSKNYEIFYSNSGSAGSASSQFVYTGIYVTYDDGTYDITTVIEGEGTVNVPATAAKDEIVTLTVTPADGYELDSLTVINTATNEAVTVTDNQFTMPAADVTITATFKTITYAVNIDTNVANGTVSVDKSTATKGDTVTVTVEAVAGYAYVVKSLKVTNDNTGDPVAVDEATKTFVMPDSSVTVTAAFEKLVITSAEIIWGSMAFTYSDEEVTLEDGTTAEKGWSPANEADAGTVTVKNTGETAFIASAAYTPYGDYGISGSLDEDKTLASNQSGTFTLTLTGKPNKALSGEKIGSVTVKIEEYDPVYLNISFGSLVMNSNREIGHSRHTVRFYDANGSLLSETAESNSATETVAVPNGAETFELYYKPYDRTQGEFPVDRSWQTTARNEVPAVDSDVSIAFTDPYTTTVTVTTAQ